jgi:UTP-glucose-1-phosphate uridylyltransferase
MKPTLVIMAAGIGSRYGGPKQLEPLGPNGETFSDYSVYDALKVGFGKVVFVLSREIEAAFRNQVGKRIEKHCEVMYVIQRLEDLPTGFVVPPNRKKPWGTAHAVLCCRSVVDTPFAVINADDFYGREAFRLIADCLSQISEASKYLKGYLVAYKLEQTLSKHGPVTRALCQVDERGYLLHIQELHKVQRFGETLKASENGTHWIEIPADSLVSMNMWGFTPAIFPELEAMFLHFLCEHQSDLETAEFLLPDVVGDLVKAGRMKVKVLPTTERWFGLTYREDKEEAKAIIEELIQQGLYPKQLWD